MKLNSLTTIIASSIIKVLCNLQHFYFSSMRDAFNCFVKSSNEKRPTSSSGTAFYKTNRSESILRSRSCWAFSHRSDPSLSQSSSALNLSQNSATQVNSKINFRFMSRVNSISFEYPVTLHSRFKKIHGFSITSGSRKSPELSQFLK